MATDKKWLFAIAGAIVGIILIFIFDSLCDSDIMSNDEKTKLVLILGVFTLVVAGGSYYYYENYLQKQPAQSELFY